MSILYDVLEVAPCRGQQVPCFECRLSVQGEVVGNIHSRKVCKTEVDNAALFFYTAINLICYPFLLLIETGVEMGLYRRYHPHGRGQWFVHS